MGDLTPHFSRAEFRCRDGSEHAIDCRLLAMLEGLRAVIGRPITITSGYRSPDYNRQVGGASNSMHLRGMAADFKVAGLSPEQVYDIADRLYPVSGLGVYPRGEGGWVHLDSRTAAARWRG